MKIVGVNGFGRIGRALLRILQSYPNIEVVAINDVTDTKTLAHLFKYDSVHGKYKGTVTFNTDTLIVNGKNIQITNEKIPANLPWRNLNIDIVIECTGKFLDYDSAFKHIEAGAKKVSLSAPPTDKKIKAICLGINDQILTVDDLIVSNASCTTNSAAPMIKVLNEMWGVSEAYITTVHSYTGDQPTLDTYHKDLYRARAAALSMIPTSTGAAKAVGLVLPELNGRLDGYAIRVPTPNVSAVDLKFISKRPTSKEEIHAAIKAAAEGPMKGVLGYTDEKLVSIDFNHSPLSSCFHLDQTKVMDGNLVSILSWYDNEWGFSGRMTDTAALMGQLI